MHNRILEAEMNNLRKRNAELVDDISRLKKPDDIPRSERKDQATNEKNTAVAQERESLIAQLEQKSIEVGYSFPLVIRLLRSLLILFKINYFSAIDLKENLISAMKKSRNLCWS